jgi:hypothetical protein
VETWVQSEFIDMAITSKSVVLATQKFDGAGSCLLFTESKIPFSFGVLFNSHVGGGSVPMTKYSEKESCYYAGDSSNPFFKLKVSINGNDTLLTMMNNAELKRTRSFSRISKKVVEKPFAYVFRANIFSGKYDVLSPDKVVVNSDVILNGDGSISGFGVADRYEVETDYSMQTENLDMIYLGKGEILEYEFKGDNINLYEWLPVDEETTKRGSLKYIFVRKP